MLDSHKAESKKQPTLIRAGVIGFIGFFLFAAGVFGYTGTTGQNSPAAQQWDHNEEAYQTRDVRIVKVTPRSRVAAYIEHEPVDPQHQKSGRVGRQYDDPSMYRPSYIESIQLGNVVTAWMTPKGDVLRPPRPGDSIDWSWYPYCFYAAGAVALIVILEVGRVMRASIAAQRAEHVA